MSSENAPRWRRYLSLHFLVGKVQEKGVVWCLKVGASKLCYLLVRTITKVLWPLYFVILDPIMKLLRVEFVFLGLPSRFGHLAAEPECYLKKIYVEDKHVRPIFLINKTKVVNAYLIRLWEQENTVWHIGSGAERLVRTLATSCLPNFVRYAYGDIRSSYNILSAYSGPPLVNIHREDLLRGETILRQMGIPDNAWFVCVHNREGGFLQESDYSTCRNADIGDYIEAIRFIVNQGGYVVRMGDPTMAKLPSIEHVVDYPHTEWKSEFMDIVLCNRCFFFLGTISGPVAVTRLFDTPICLANIVPLLEIPINAGKVFIPKLIYSTKENRYLTFAEIICSDIGHLYRTKNYASRDLIVQENSSAEIVELVREMLKIQTGSVRYSNEDEELQAAFRKIFSDAGVVFRSSARIGRHFARKYRHLFKTE